MGDSLYLRFLNLVAIAPHVPALQWQSHVFRRQDLENALANLIDEISESPHKSVGYWGENHPLGLLLPLACSALGKTYFPFSPLFSSSTVADLCKAHDTFLVNPLHDSRWDSLFLQWSKVRSNGFTYDKANKIDKVDSTTVRPLIAFQTSGTTDRPKRVLLPESHILSNIDEAIRAQGLQEADRILLVLSLCHSGGLCIQALPGLFSGALLIMHPAFQIPDFLASFRQNNDASSSFPTTTLIVPAYLRQLLRSNNAELSTLSLARFIGIGSAPVTSDALSPFINAGAKFLNIYGLTEAGPVLATQMIDSACFDRENDPPIGKVAPTIEWRIDPQTSELWVRGPAVRPSYEEEHVVTPSLTADGWFNTRDLVSQDHGVLKFLGRRSFTFNIGGMKVHGERIENAIEQLPDIAACVVNCRQHRIYGEILVATVERDPSKEPISKRELLKRLRASGTGLAEHEIPREVDFVDSIPRSSIGKKIRARLS
ncbi:MAG: long-chain fatty acid--CoA ligase [Deltaproteobacteria bacterium]|jgi:acyl-CoA synthetase (AMP-forming)/AMP-acid ligase II|nr:long-chain fatty acid--CoA ligase [Deltaproteobacteria bacterium]